jgi:general secretion pathway protein N
MLNQDGKRKTTMARYIIFGIVFYLGFLLTTLPADLVYGYWKNSAGKATPVFLEGVDGSVWSGKVALANISGQQLQNLKWQFKPWKMLLGDAELAMYFKMKDGYGKGVLGYNVFGKTYARNLDAWLPMGWVLPMFNLGSLKPGGALAVNLKELQLRNKTVATALGSLVWQDAEITILKPMPLGSFKVELEPTNEGIKGVISDMGGPLQIEGLINLDQQGKYNLTAEVAVRDPNQQDLKSAISSLGRPDRNGKVKLQQSGDLAALGLL